MPDGQVVGCVHVHEVQCFVAGIVGEPVQPVRQVGRGALAVDHHRRVVFAAQAAYLLGGVAGAVQDFEQLRGYGAVVVADAGGYARVGAVNVNGDCEHDRPAVKLRGLEWGNGRGRPGVGVYDAFGQAHVTPVAERSGPAGWVVAPLFAEVLELVAVPEQAGGRMIAHYQVQILGVGVGRQSEIEPAGTA